MRTTINIEDDLAEALKKEAADKNRPFTEIVNQAIRAGLPQHTPAGSPYRVKVFRTTLVPGIDSGKMNQLAGELEDEELIRRMKAFEADFEGEPRG